MAKDQKKEEAKGKKVEKKAELKTVENKDLHIQMVKTIDIKGHYPWKPEHRLISRKMGDFLFLSTKDDVKRNGIQEALHLVRLDEAPDHVENKEDWKVGYYTLSGRNRWDIAKELGIKEVKAEIAVAGPYDRMVAYAIRSNLFRKSAKEKEDAKVDSADMDKDLRKGANKADDISTALDRGTWIEVVVGYDPEASEKLRAAKVAEGNTKDAEKKEQLHGEVVQLEASVVSLKTCGEVLGISEATAIRCYWFLQAIKEDAKDSGLRPKDGHYDYGSWMDMAEAKGIPTTYEAFMRVRGGKEKPDPEPKPLKIKVEDNETGFMANTFVEFQEKLLKAKEENPEGMFFLNLAGKVYTDPKDIPEALEGGIKSESVIPAIIGSQEAEVEKKTEEVGERNETIEKLKSDLEEAVESRGVEYDKREALEKELKAAQAKIAKWDAKPAEEKEEILNAENYYADRTFTAKDVSEIYGWLDQQLKVAMDKFGGLVKFITLKTEYGPKK